MTFHTLYTRPGKEAPERRYFTKRVLKGLEKGVTDRKKIQGV